MSELNHLAENLKAYFKDSLLETTSACNELTIEVAPEQLHATCYALRHEKPFLFQTLIDICGVDYKEYGVGEWLTDSTTHTGFDRAMQKSDSPNNPIWKKQRFSVVYHLLSLEHNHRLRLRAFAKTPQETEGKQILPTLDTVTDIWSSAMWYEREVFDLYGIHFQGHPDLRRLLTDYDFEGHPFRKDFPLTGHVEVRYDATLEKVIYEPVTSVVPRSIIPKVTRAQAKTSIDDLQENPTDDHS